MAYWNRKEKVERPEWPKLIALRGTMDEAKALEPQLKADDAEAEVVEGGGYGVFARCFNEKSEKVALRFGKDEAKGKKGKK